MRYMLLVVGGLMDLIGVIWLLQASAYCPEVS